MFCSPSDSFIGSCRSDDAKTVLQLPISPAILMPHVPQRSSVQGGISLFLSSLVTMSSEAGDSASAGTQNGVQSPAEIGLVALIEGTKTSTAKI